jgi:Secretion system C-terminal sorting domain
MKEIIIITCVVFFSTNVIAQSDKKATIRIKRVENINGVEKVSDTSFIADDAAMVKLHGENVDIKEIKESDGTVKKVVIIKDKSGNSKGDKSTISLEKSDVDLEKLINEMELKDLGNGKQQVIIYKTNDENGKESLNKLGKLSKSSALFINITNADTEDKIKLNEKSAVDADQLKIERFDFFPNPSNGKFNLSFNLTNKGNTKVSVLSMDGKVVYDKNLDNFTGEYKTEINISENAKGVYFIKVEQNEQSILKKIVLD